MEREENYGIPTKGERIIFQLMLPDGILTTYGKVGGKPGGEVDKAKGEATLTCTPTSELFRTSWEKRKILPRSGEKEGQIKREGYERANQTLQRKSLLARNKQRNQCFSKRRFTRRGGGETPMPLKRQKEEKIFRSRKI